MPDRLMGQEEPILDEQGRRISRSTRSDADVDYLFLQVVVDKAEVSDSQNCGNILAAVGPLRLKGLLEPQVIY